MKKIAFCIFTMFFIAPWAQSEELLPLSDRDKKFSEFVENLDLDADNVSLEYKSGTTSIGMKIRIDDDYKAYWLPNENGAGKAEGQVVAYTLAQFLGISKIVVPSDYLFVGGDALQQFSDMLDNNSDSGQWKIKNKKKIKPAVKKNIQSGKAHYGALSLKKKKFAANSMVGNNTLRSSHALAKMIKATGPMPSATEVYDGLNTEFKKEYKKGEVNFATELQLARDLSKIMLLDSLIGQWDRFSGGNLEARFFRKKDDPLKGRIRFFARDNGGSSATSATPVSTHFKKYLGIVTRFDREQTQRLRDLQAWLADDPETVKEHFKYRSGVKSLTSRVNAMLKHIDKQIDKYGEQKVYFPDSE